MLSKKELINNLLKYNTDQIAEAINAGVVTMYELSKSGYLTPLMRKRIEEKLMAKTTQLDKQLSLNEPFVAPVVKDGLTDNFENEMSPISGSYNDFAPSSKKKMFLNPFSFKERIRRTEYGISFIIFCLILCIIAFLIWYLIIKTSQYEPYATIIFFPLFILMCWVLCAQGCKRCHDRGNSG